MNQLKLAEIEDAAQDLVIDIRHEMASIEDHDSEERQTLLKAATLIHTAWSQLMSL